jgi:mRNA interferase YafQ
MRTIERTNIFRRDFKREKAGRHKHEIDVLLSTVISLLAKDNALPEKTRDHGLGGEWRDHRECHLKPDLLLIYRKPSLEVLQLVRLGSTASSLVSARVSCFHANGLN